MDATEFFATFDQRGCVVFLMINFPIHFNFLPLKFFSERISIYLYRVFELMFQNIFYFYAGNDNMIERVAWKVLFRIFLSQV